MTSLVRLSIDREIATITFDSPHNRNALSQQLLVETHAAIDQAEAAQVRSIILDHSGPAFCSGADLKERASNTSDSGRMATLIERLGTTGRPTIAAVRGPVRAGGIGVMAACDLVVAHTSVTFAFTEVRLGVAPAIISVPILNRCGWAGLAAAFLTGQSFTAAEAASLHLVNQVTDNVDEAIAELVDGILASEPNAVAATKQLLRRPMDLAAAQRLSEQLFNSPAAAEGMRAFAEKRPPRWAAP